MVRWERVREEGMEKGTDSMIHPGIVRLTVSGSSSLSSCGGVDSQYSGLEEREVRWSQDHTET